MPRWFSPQQPATEQTGIHRTCPPHAPTLGDRCPHYPPQSCAPWATWTEPLGPRRRPHQLRLRKESSGSSSQILIHHCPTLKEHGLTERQTVEILYFHSSSNLKDKNSNFYNIPDFKPRTQCKGKWAEDQRRSKLVLSSEALARRGADRGCRQPHGVWASHSNANLLPCAPHCSAVLCPNGP